MLEYKLEKQFGVLFSIIFLILALWSIKNSQTIAWLWGVLTLSLSLLTWQTPQLFHIPVKIWMKMAHVLGIINTHILLAIAFFIFIMPVALLFRLVGRDALRIKQQKTNSYWITKNNKWLPDSFKNQF